MADSYNLPYVETRADLESRRDDDDLEWLDRYPSATHFGIDDHVLQVWFKDEASAIAWRDEILAERENMLANRKRQ